MIGASSTSYSSKKFRHAQRSCSRASFSCTQRAVIHRLRAQHRELRGADRRARGSAACAFSSAYAGSGTAIDRYANSSVLIDGVASCGGNAGRASTFTVRAGTPQCVGHLLTRRVRSRATPARRRRWPTPRPSDRSACGRRGAAGRSCSPASRRSGLASMSSARSRSAAERAIGPRRRCRVPRARPAARGRALGIESIRRLVTEHAAVSAPDCGSNRRCRSPFRARSDPAASAAAEPPDEPPGVRPVIPRIVRGAVDVVVALEVAEIERHVRLAEHVGAGRAHAFDHDGVGRRRCCCATPGCPTSSANR